MSQKFSMFFKNIAKSKNLCFLLSKNIFILVFITTQNWLVEKFDKNLIKSFLTQSQNSTDTIWIVQGVCFFTDTVWILGPHGQANKEDSVDKS